MKILLLSDQNEETREKVVFSLESTFQASVLQAPNFDNAVEQLLAPEAPFDLLVCDWKKGSILEFEIFQKKTSTTPTILIVDGKPDRQPPVEWNVVAMVDRGQLINGVVSAINKQFEKGTLKAAPETNRAAFCRIRAKLLLSVCPLRGDIYIRLSDTKFVKLFRTGDDFEMADLQKYTVKKGVEYFYIRNEETKEFIEKYDSDLQKYLKKSYQLSMQEAVKVNDSIYETVQELGKQLGFTREVQSLCRTQIRMTVKSLGKNPTLADILSKLEAFRGQYLAAHSALAGYFACAIASQLEWGSESTFQKLMLASFLHDITLENHELAKCTTIEQAEKGDFTRAEIEAFKEHPVLSSQIASRFQEVPPDVDVIIAQHHETPEGSGFPRAIGHAYISPLAATFCVAHELAVACLDEGQKNFKVDKFLNKVREKYSSIRYRKILSAIEEVFTAQARL